MSYIFITFSNKNHLDMNKTFREQAPVVINETFLLTQNESEYFLFYTSFSNICWNLTCIFLQIFLFVTGTVSTCGKPFQYHLACVIICIIRIATFLTNKGFLWQTISLFYVTTFWALTRSIIRKNWTKSNTVLFTQHLYPL